MFFVNKIPTSKEELAAHIDHTLLKPDAPISRYVDEWVRTSHFGFRAFVAPLPVIEFLETSGVYDLPNIRLATVIGFPNGYHVIQAKITEIRQAADANVNDVDFVPNLVLAKSGEWDKVEEEVRVLINTAKEYGLTTKIILETGYLSKEELTRLASIAVKHGVDYLKTSTGFGPRGASVDDILYLRKLANKKAGIKASGGIRTFIQAVLFIALGADVIGTSSGVAIVNGFSEEIIKNLNEG